MNISKIQMHGKCLKLRDRSLLVNCRWTLSSLIPLLSFKYADHYSFFQCRTDINNKTNELMTTFKFTR